MLCCEVVRDLFPSHIDHLTSEQSNQLIEEHLEECEECRKILEKMEAEVSAPTVQKNLNQIRPFKKLKRYVWKAVAATAAICILVFGGWFYLFEYGWEAKADDVEIQYQKKGDIFEITFVSKNNFGLNGYHNSTSTEIEFRQTLKGMGKDEKAYYSLTFVGEDTVMVPGEENRKLTEKDILTLDFKDQKIQIPLLEAATEVGF